MTFNAIIGQSDKKDYLRRMVDANRVPHAFLFLGPEGCGKLASAIAFAQYLLCENRQEQEACGSCSNCVKASKLAHPDLHFSYPTVGTNVKSDQYLPDWRSLLQETAYPTLNQWLQHIGAENRQGNINREECLNIVRKLSLKTFEANYKILLMWMPEYLGKEGNRLLKLIEEPPEQTIFILVAENQELILNTIISRCQVVQFNALSDEAIAEGLQQQLDKTPEEALKIAQLANGNFHEAQQLAVQAENDNATLFLDWMRKCYKGNGVELVEWVTDFAKIGRENQKFFLQYALHFMREYLYLKATGDASRLRLRPEEQKTAKNLTKVIGLEQVDAIVQLLNEYSYYIERNANPKVLFLDGSIRMHNILKQKALTTA